MLCSRSSGKGWHCKKETDLSYKLCYHHRQAAEILNSRRRKKSRAAGICVFCHQRKGKKGCVSTCEVCAPIKAKLSIVYKKLHKEQVDDYNRVWMGNLRAGQPTTIAGRARMIARAEVDRDG